jgi:multidrug efflux pump subunit AcrA (membrane-fusion protein)
MSLVQWHFASRRHRKPVTFLFTGAAMLALMACGEKNATAPPPPRSWRAAQQPVTRYIEVTGNTSRSAPSISRRVQGFLEQINYVDGALVKKDSVLFVIQRNTYEAQLAQAKATLAGNQAAQLNAQIEYDRQAQLQQQQVSTQAKLDDAKQKLDQAIAGVDSAKANLEIAQINLGYTEVAAPFDGIATRHLVNVGALVGYAGPTKLATVVQVDPIYVYFNISETIVAYQGAGQAGQDAARRAQSRSRSAPRPRADTLTRASSYVAPQVDRPPALRARDFGNKDLALLLTIRARAFPCNVSTNPGRGYRDRHQPAGEYVSSGKDNTVEQRQVSPARSAGGSGGRGPGSGRRMGHH